MSETASQKTIGGGLYCQHGWPQVYKQQRETSRYVTYVICGWMFGVAWGLIATALTLNAVMPIQANNATAQLLSRGVKLLMVSIALPAAMRLVLAPAYKHVRLHLQNGPSVTCGDCTPGSPHNP